jgi:hypothetical protein
VINKFIWYILSSHFLLKLNVPEAFDNYVAQFQPVPLDISQYDFSSVDEHALQVTW